MAVLPMIASIESTPEDCEYKEGTFAFPVTVSQQAFWYLDRLRPGNPANNIAVRFRITGPLRVDCLDRALSEVVRRNEALRTTITVVDGDLAQVVAPPTAVTIPIDDLRGAVVAQERDLLSLQEATGHFYLEVGPLFRLCASTDRRSGTRYSVDDAPHHRGRVVRGAHRG